MKLPWKKKLDITAMAGYRRSALYHMDSFHFGETQGDVWIRIGKGLKSRWTHVLVRKDRKTNEWCLNGLSEYGRLHYPMDLPEKIDSYWQQSLDYADAHPLTKFGTASKPVLPHDQLIVEKPTFNGDSILKWLTIALVVVVGIFVCLTIARGFLFLYDHGLLR